MLLKPKEYIERLSGYRRNIYVLGKRVEDIVNHRISGQQLRQ